MSELTILSCTNRPGSNTLKVSRIYERILIGRGLGVKLLDMSRLPENIAFTETFGRRSEMFERLIAEYITASGKFIFVVPEYNGSFPGILKVFLESVHPREWADKDACLVGIADGRAGNLRGLEHLTGILQYLKMNVYHNKLPISLITQIIDGSGAFTNPVQQQVCEEQVDGFLRF